MSTVNKKMLLAMRRKVHALKPIVIIGANGLTEAVHKEIETALNAHELIKIRVNAEDHAEFQHMHNEICNVHNAALVQTIGHVIAIFRPQEDA